MTPDVSHPVLFSLGMETILVLVTMIFLVQPKLLLPARSEKARHFLTVSGMFMLCVTFCWSVVVGCVLTLNHLTIRL